MQFPCSSPQWNWQTSDSVAWSLFIINSQDFAHLVIFGQRRSCNDFQWCPNFCLEKRHACLHPCSSWVIESIVVSERCGFILKTQYFFVHLMVNPHASVGVKQRVAANNSPVVAFRHSQRSFGRSSTFHRAVVPIGTSRYPTIGWPRHVIDLTIGRLRRTRYLRPPAKKSQNWENRFCCDDSYSFVVTLCYTPQQVKRVSRNVPKLSTRLSFSKDGARSNASAKGRSAISCPVSSNRQLISLLFSLISTSCSSQGRKDPRPFFFGPFFKVNEIRCKVFCNDWSRGRSNCLIFPFWGSFNRIWTGPSGSQKTSTTCGRALGQRLNKGTRQPAGEKEAFNGWCYPIPCYIQTSNFNKRNFKSHETWCQPHSKEQKPQLALFSSTKHTKPSYRCGMSQDHVKIIGPINECQREYYTVTWMIMDDNGWIQHDTTNQVVCGPTSCVSTFARCARPHLWCRQSATVQAKVGRFHPCLAKAVFAKLGKNIWCLLSTSPDFCSNLKCVYCNQNLSTSPQVVKLSTAEFVQRLTKPCLWPDGFSMIRPSMVNRCRRCPKHSPWLVRAHLRRSFALARASSACLSLSFYKLSAYFCWTGSPISS